MNLRFLSLVCVLTTVAPMAVQAQRMPNPQELPAPDLKKIPPIKLGTTFSGTITAKDLAKVTQEFGQVKCSQFQVTLQADDPYKVVVEVPGQPKKSQFPGSGFDAVTVQAIGNHLGLGCTYSLTVPDSAKGKQGYLWIKGLTNKKDVLLLLLPQGWQNPMPVHSSGNIGRNFVVDVKEPEIIK
jgi:hypothetical protein